MNNESVAVTIGRLIKDGKLFGYLAIDTQQCVLSRREGFRVHKWEEVKKRYRLDLLTAPDEGFLTPDDEASLAAGSFLYMGELLKFEELSGAERERVLRESFAGWD
jgi:hypothetical protein